MTIPVVVKKRTTGTPSSFFLRETCLSSYISKGPISIVMEENVMTEETAKEVIQAIIVVVTYADTGLPSRNSEARFLCDIGKGSITIIFIEVGGWSLTRWPGRIKSTAIGQVDIQPAIVVEIEEGQSASFGFDDGSLVFDATPHVWDIESSLLSYIDELNIWGG